uniref:Reverse transcriptase-rnase h-integrase n=1 Tax=Moniliophthora roreri TaxID=221103 RepID=A0A0W0F252_MONRR
MLKKLSVQEAFTKIKAMVLEQGEAEQEEIFDLMGKEEKTHFYSFLHYFGIGTL